MAALSSSSAYITMSSLMSLADPCARTSSAVSLSATFVGRASQVDDLRRIGRS